MFLKVFLLNLLILLFKVKLLNSSFSFNLSICSLLHFKITFFKSDNIAIVFPDLVIGGFNKIIPSNFSEPSKLTIIYFCVSLLTFIISIY